MASQSLDLLDAEPSQESQGIEIPNVQKKLEQHKLRLKQRRKQRNEAIAQGHRARVDKLKADYESASTRHAEAMYVFAYFAQCTPNKVLIVCWQTSDSVPTGQPPAGSCSSKAATGHRA
ncbi:hypothetical protein LTR78_002589 [Recurvomyces mirabilis]|uniref:Uncharacterized protein n=1 Tax=Recurvomyces mirabilis TaxID=574656 RepID=A0AAE0WTZ8_9PEZI|nr:hypothetical protein LTR78_002589 [Recurvomyces mirabilis]KAK5157518.1 hypothetical protein LTS14_004283 [Recurvomyces mirabilis]